MDKFTKLIVALCLMLTFIASCTKANEPTVTDKFTYSRILGKWEMTAYQTSDGYFTTTTSKEHFVFSDDETYTRDLDGWVTHGTFKFNPKANVIFCEESRGWNLQIVVDFTGEDSAIFYIKGRTSTSSEIIKVERNEKINQSTGI